MNVNQFGFWMLSAVVVFSTVHCTGQVNYHRADAWPETFGNHRYRIVVPEAADAVWLHLDWRRRDPQPETIGMVLYDAASNQPISNMIPVHVSREFGDVVFQPVTGPGEYFLYTMPYERTGPFYSFSVKYREIQTTADPKWLQKNHLTEQELQAGTWKSLPQALVVTYEARGEFHRYTEMERIATAEETGTLFETHARENFLLFPEDRKFPIRMVDDLPLRWIQRGPSNQFSGVARPGEFYVFQVGVVPVEKALKNVQLSFSELTHANGTQLAADAFRCFNLRGVDWLGQPFMKEVSIDRRKAGALWIGVQIPTDIAEGIYEGTIGVRGENAAVKAIQLKLDIHGDVLSDAGDSELWRMARLRWLDSTIGIDDDVVAPYTPLDVKQETVSCLGRSVDIAATGLLRSIQAGGKELLAQPLRLDIETSEGVVPWQGGKPRFTKQTPGTVIWESEVHGGKWTMQVRAEMEFDGYINFHLSVTPEQETSVRDIRLVIPLRAEAAPFMMGMGRKGGNRPQEWNWVWDENLANNAVWLGDVDGGLQCKLKGPKEVWNLYRLGPGGIPDSWGNQGKGGCRVFENDKGEIVLNAYSGERTLAAGEAIEYKFGLLITPVKPIYKDHWKQRYFHAYEPVDKVVATGANIINIHHANEINPFINYPFIKTNVMKDYIKQAHDKNIKVKIYYTVRELSDYVAEMWALRSLGDEIFTGGYSGAPLADQFADTADRKRLDASETKEPGGDAWLREHLIDHYAPAWHHTFDDGVVDASIATTGLSRWHNYYLEGLRWLLQNVEIDGLYLDGIGYDRVIMKRVRKVMERYRPGSLIDFHSGNNFAPEYGLSNCANQYMEHLPYIDSVWFGEGFDYNESPDYWMVEISGIPFGLMGEMLHGGGNPWRGMVYGMTNRLPWSGDPREIWKVWDRFGIQDADMLGYWDKSCPVRTDRDDVLVTVYRKKDRTMLAVASWAKEAVLCRLQVDWKALGLQENKTQVTAEAIPGFQDAATFKPSEAIPVEPGKGWLLILSE